MKYTRYLLLIVITVLGYNTAHAETFTYESSGDRDPATVVGGIGPDGDYVGAFWTSESTLTYANGKTLKSTSTCVSMMQPPRNNIFTSHVACDISNSEGVSSAVMGCTVLNKETNEMSCIGAITGKSGKRKGKSGNITSHVKGGVSKGTGQWFE